MFTRVQKVSSVCWNVSFFIPSFFPSLIQTVLTASLKECSKEVNAIFWLDSSSYHLVFAITVFSFYFSFYSVLCSIPSTYVLLLRFHSIQSCVLSLLAFAKCISFAFSFMFSLVIPSCVRRLYLFSVFILSVLLSLFAFAKLYFFCV